MIRIKCESNNVTQSRLQSIVNSLFPKGSKAVVPRDAPLNIFVKIIQFIAQEKLDFAMREIVFDLLSVGRPIKVINAPERMSIGLRSFLVVADSLQQKEGDPPMPRTVAVMPSGSTLRVKKTFLSKMLTDEAAKNIGISSYYPYVRKVFDDILRALDLHFGKPFLMTNTQNAAKEADDTKPKLDLFRTVIAAIPRLIPDGMSRGELVDTLSRLTVHNDEELRGLAYQSLQNLINDFPDWREDVLFGFMQFVVKEITDQQSGLLDNALRMVFQLLSAWRNAADKGATSGGRHGQQHHDPTRTHDQHGRPDLATTLHMAEGFALVMLCHCRLTTRRICLMVLKEVKQLFKILGSLREDMTVIDALDKSTTEVVGANLNLMPIQDKTAATNVASVDFQWLTERNSSQWTAGFNDDGIAKSGSTQHLFNADPWSACLMGFLQPDRLPAQCPSAVFQAWPTVHIRLTQVFTVVDPAPVADNRASLLRPGTAPKKTLNEKDISMHLWKNYIAFACRIVPPIPSPVIRCVSPDLLLSSCSSSSPESLGIERADSKSPSLSAALAVVSPTVFYKLLVPLLRCEVSDMRDSVVQALGRINHVAIMDLMAELVVYIREAIDRKQENMRRRRRRDALRLQLVRVFDIIASQGTLSRAGSPVTGEGDSGLAATFTEYIDGARLYLETEADKNEIGPSVREIKAYFCSFIRNLIGSFSLERRKNLLRKDLRRNLFYLFASWSGHFGHPFDMHQSAKTAATKEDMITGEFEFSALQSMITVLCCGSCFDEKALLEEGSLYTFLDVLLNSKEKKIYSLAQKTIVLLLEFNPDLPTLLDWVVDECFTGKDQVADGCFLALATIFATREYPCDHYTAIINVTLMNTGCPRTEIHETALQLLQILDKRFFGSYSPLSSSGEAGEGGGGGKDPPRRSTLDVLLSTTYSRSQLYLSRQLAQLHPELTMPMFSEICHRLQTARPSVTKCLLYYLLPWLYNMELVDPNVNIELTASLGSGGGNGGGGSNSDSKHASNPRGREGWGTAEATEMITNNLFYITVKFGDEHPKEVEELWSALCACWPKNLRVIIRYLFIISGMAPLELIDYAKRVVLYLGRTQPMKTLDEMMLELQTVETLNCTIERTEMPPFYRLTSLRKASSNSESNIQLTSSRQDLSSVEKGTIHTKRHSQEEQQRENSSNFTAPFKSAGNMASYAGSAMVARIQMVGEKVRQAYTKPSLLGSSGGSVVTGSNAHISATTGSSEQQSSMSQSLVLSSEQVQVASSSMSQSEHQYQNTVNFDLARSCSPSPSPKEVTKTSSSQERDSHDQQHQHPMPLPMPEYGGWFAPLTEFLPPASQPIANSHRCNLAVILITHLVVDGLDLDCHSVDWSVHVPLMLHIIFLGLDNSRELIYRHCQQLLLNLLMVVCEHNDHLSVSSILMNNHSQQMEYGLTLQPLPIMQHNFTEKAVEVDTYLESNLEQQSQQDGCSEDDEAVQMKPVITGTDEDGQNMNVISADTTVADLTKALIHFIASRKSQALWQYEDITRTVWTIRSAEQIDIFLQHVLQSFELSLPHAHLAERWSQLALQLALSCSSRHYAGRSLQIFRALRVPITSRMLSDILSRLVETIAEQGEDMQGYVTELILTLEAVVDALDSDIRPMDLNRDIFKSTPNLKDMSNSSSGEGGGGGHRYGGPYGGAGAKAAARKIYHQNAAAESSTSPIGHGYHASAPPGGPFSMYHYDRSVSYNAPPMSYHKPISPTSNLTCDIRGRSSTESGGPNGGGGRSTSASLSRSRSAQSLKLQDQGSQDDKMNILVQLFWICLAVLESDYEHEFLLGLRLLERVLSKLPLDRPDVREKVEKLQIQLKWPNFPGVHSLLLKGCTNPNTYEATIQVLSQMTLLLDFAVIDPSQSLAFPMNVIALLPYLVQNYEDANDLCIRSAENIAQVSTEKNKKLENLATVMTLYSRRTFSKESFQWTKCVVKYLYDLYSHFSFNMLGFLVEVLEKGSSNIQCPVMTIIHCLLHYVDMSQATQTINADLLRTVAKFVESPHWKEALKILKLAVTRSSTLVAPPSNPGSLTYHWEASSGSNFAEPDLYFKKELPGRTMEFTFDLSQTPVIGRRTQQQPPPSSSSSRSSAYHYSTALSSLSSANAPSLTGLSNRTGGGSVNSASSDAGSRKQETVDAGTSASCLLSPKRSLSLTMADSASFSGWKRPWMSQSAVRERLVNLLNSCGQRVGLPKSPSGENLNIKVIFSQTSELFERQSSMASSTEEVSANNDVSIDSKQHDTTDTEQKFGMYMREFDFLEYELESLEGESVDNFNWGVRRPSLSHLEGSTAGDFDYRMMHDSFADATPVLPKRDGVGAEESSDDEFGSHLSARSSVDENSGASSSVSSTSSGLFPPKSLPLDAIGKRRFSTPNSGLESDDDTDDEGEMSDHDLTPCNASPSLSQLLDWSGGGSGNAGARGGRYLLDQDEVEEVWKSHVHALTTQSTSNEILLETFSIFGRLFNELRTKTCVMSQDSVYTLNKEKSPFSQELIKMAAEHFQELTDILSDVSYSPFVWCEFDNIGGSRMIERVKFYILELQENFENFCDKKELTLECLDAVKAHQKLVNLGENLSHYNIDTEQVDLCRCLYKLHFQLLLLLETFAKLLRHIRQSATSESAKDISKDLIDIRKELLMASTADLLSKSLAVSDPSNESNTTNAATADTKKEEDSAVGLENTNDELSTPKIKIIASREYEIHEEYNEEEEESDGCSLNSSEISAVETVLFAAQSRRESEYHVFGLVCEAKFAAAMVYYKQQHWVKWSGSANRGQVDKTDTELVEDILALYCQILAERGENVICVTVSESEIGDHCSRLMDASLQLLSTVKSMENQLARQKQRPSSASTNNVDSAL